MPFIYQRKGEDGLCKYFMINLHVSYVVRLEFKHVSPPHPPPPGLQSDMLPTLLCSLAPLLLYMPKARFRLRLELRELDVYHTPMQLVRCSTYILSVHNSVNIWWTVTSKQYALLPHHGLTIYQVSA